MLNLYSYDDFTDVYSPHSNAGSLTNPMTMLHDPAEQSVVIKKVFLRNDNANMYYTSVVLQYRPITTTVDNANGWVFKLLYQDREPTAGEWSIVASGNSVVVGTIGESDSADLDFHPLWIRVEAPMATPNGVYDEPYIAIDYDSEVPVSG